MLLQKRTSEQLEFHAAKDSRGFIQPHPSTFFFFSLRQHRFEPQRLERFAPKQLFGPNCPLRPPPTQPAGRLRRGVLTTSVTHPGQSKTLNHISQPADPCDPIKTNVCSFISLITITNTLIFQEDSIIYGKTFDAVLWQNL